MVIANLWAPHNDPHIWDEPEKFKPERFEGVEGNRVGFKMMPFGPGRRSCPGEGLAVRVLGLTLGSLLHCFEWERVSRELVDMKEGGGISLAKFYPLWAKCSPRHCMFKELIQDSHAVGNIHHLIIASDLRNEVSWVVEVRGYGHPDSKGANILIFLKQLLNLNKQSKEILVNHLEKTATSNNKQ
ncbi:hypothetical protein Cgig2_003237 [Carnegiea gigantea]|uniref:Cytochrome P450 n=1 Tax=Carnegiea gigantea TaxID=171969 RepID=A0A9Q1JTS8_9CARY|nr:hypothetical protein Cgig2_003237 [Carnegiea gigantea]